MHSRHCANELALIVSVFGSKDPEAMALYAQLLDEVRSSIPVTTGTETCSLIKDSAEGT